MAQARAALLVATDPGVITVLRARVKHEDETLAQIAARFGMTKAAYWSRLRRALADAKTNSRPPRVPPEPQPAVAHAGPSPRSANAIRIGMGRRRTPDRRARP